jgi:3,4-dihydroxy-2-butanone 4-phosphate synthase
MPLISPRQPRLAVSTIEEVVEDIRAGKMIILVDDEDRENEGDLYMAAQMSTPDAINFMATHGRGLICLTLTQETGLDTATVFQMLNSILKWVHPDYTLGRDNDFKA